jgi:flagellar assembly factor FliW
MLIARDRPEEQGAGAPSTTAAEGADLFDGTALDFGGGIPGFPGTRNFRLESLTPDLRPFCVMRSVEEDGISFVLVPPGALFPDYTIEIDEQQVSNLGLQSAEDAVVLAIVTVGPQPTANLLGPLVVNRRTRAAAQVVQHQSSYRAAEPLVSLSGT